MNTVLAAFLSLFFISCMEETAKNQSGHKLSRTQKTNDAKTLSPDKFDIEDEDCDDKFKKLEEQKKEIDENNLFGQNTQNKGDAGCTIE